MEDDQPEIGGIVQVVLNAFHLMPCFGMFEEFNFSIRASCHQYYISSRIGKRFIFYQLN
jgi:hypothetical protein